MPYIPSSSLRSVCYSFITSIHVFALGFYDFSVQLIFIFRLIVFLTCLRYFLLCASVKNNFLSEIQRERIFIRRFSSFQQVITLRLSCKTETYCKLEIHSEADLKGWRLRQEC